MRKYARFISGLHKYFRGRLEPQEALEQARKLLKKRIASRERNFLSLVEKGIFGYSKSPYLRLLAAKRIAFDDIRKWVESEGIEATLARLLNEGDALRREQPQIRDRKSTRLNSSHGYISYAVF